MDEYIDQYREFFKWDIVDGTLPLTPIIQVLPLRIDPELEELWKNEPCERKRAKFIADRILRRKDEHTREIPRNLQIDP